MMHLLITLTLLLLGLTAHAFVFPPGPGATTKLSMGFFDGLSKAFSNEEYGAPPDAVKANARHILVKSKEEVNTIMIKLQNGESWNSLASQYSTCPSKSQGGSLGSFSPGTMVAEFDKVIFSPETKIGEIMGPVETKFGYHLIVVDKRTGGGDWY
jgi:peptidyl-prolyl cis-trans isomerase C